MFRAFGHITRLLQIARLLARHDALFLLETLDIAPSVVWLAKTFSKKNAEGRPGERLARALAEAGPSFIKLGQALSTRSDILGEEITADLSELQDNLPPFSSEEARSAIEAEFEQPVEVLFRSFDDEAIAAASIAQVHFAETAEGEAVAVKILRPGIEQAFNRDLDLFLWVAQLVEKTRPEWRRLKPVESIRTLAHSVEIEMDLRFEASAAAEMAENFADDETFHVPGIDWTRTGKRVLTTTRIMGIPIDDREALLKAGHDLEDVIKKSAAAFFKQVFRDGFFHADLHPGNLFVQQDGSIAAVDFGIMGRIDRRTRRWLGEMLLGFLNRNYRRAAEVHFEAGWVPSHHSVEAFTQACRSIAEPILDKPQNEISIARLLAHLFQVTETFDMEAQPQLLLLQKTMLVAEGTVRALNPDANMWMLARPLIEEWMNEHMRPEQVIAEELSDMTETMRRLPRLLEGMEQSARAMAGGEVRLHPDSVSALKRSDNGSWSRTTAFGLITLVIAIVLLIALAL
ncbi:MAG: 2-polyprenylphenol 6-hydroxylase [Rhodospirillales bacterium]